MFTRVMIYTAFVKPVDVKIRRNLAKLINEQVSSINKDMKARSTVKSLNDVYRDFLFNDETPIMKGFIKKLQDFSKEHEGVFINIWTIPEKEFVRRVEENRIRIIYVYGRYLRNELYNSDVL